MNNTSNTYLKLCTEYYDLTKPHAPEHELLFYLDYAKKACGPILEPMCGTGRFLIPLLERGFDSEGFDSSPYMLDLFKQKCAKKNLNPRVSQRVLQDFKSEKKYNLIFIPTGSFGLITDEHQVQECLSILYNHLAPDGKLLFEIDTPCTLKSYPFGTWKKSVQKKDDSSSIILHQLPFYHESSQIFEVLCRYEHVNNDTILGTEVENFCVKLYENDDLDPLLKNIGFSVTKYQDHNKSSVTNDAKIIIYECAK